MFSAPHKTPRPQRCCAQPLANLERDQPENRLPATGQKWNSRNYTGRLECCSSSMFHRSHPYLHRLLLTKTYLRPLHGFLTPGALYFDNSSVSINGHTVFAHNFAQGADGGETRCTSLAHSCGVVTNGAMPPWMLVRLPLNDLWESPYTPGSKGEYCNILSCTSSEFLSIASHTKCLPQGMLRLSGFGKTCGTQVNPLKRCRT